MKHCIRTSKPDFAEISAGKQFEVLKSDRDYFNGDTVFFQEYDTEAKKYTGKEEARIITQAINNAPFLKAGYTVLILKEPNE